MISLPKELQIIAEKELNEIPHRVIEDLHHFKEWLRKQPHIIARNDDKWLLGILRISKWSLEKAKKQIDSFYTIKTAFPGIFKNRNVSLPFVQHLLNDNIVGILPPEAIDRPVVVVAKGGRANPDILKAEDTIKFCTMLFEVIIREYDNFIMGQVLLYDFKDISLKYVQQLTPSVLKKLVTCVQIAYPARLKAVYFVNVPSVFMYMYNIIKSFLSLKMANRLHFIPDDGKDIIQKYIPTSILPIDFGGNGPSMSVLSKQLKSKLESYSNWYLEEEQYGCDESKRPPTSKSDIDLFGIDGTFRKLDID